MAAAAPAAANGSRERLARWLAPALAALGGLAAGAALVAGAMLIVGGLPSAGGSPAPGEPLPFAAAAALGGDPEPVGQRATPAELVVDVAGAVARPGLHRLASGDRVGDAIEAAGGFAPRADLAATSETLNLAQALQDGAKVLVPELGHDRAATQALEADGRVDLNEAGRAALEALPGIGPVTAGKIIAAREDQRFGSARELRSRGLVGDRVYEDIKGLVRAS